MMKKKKVKKYAEGGLAGLAETAESLMGDVDNMANTINYGSSTPGIGNTAPFDPGAISTFKRGGAVNENKMMKSKGRNMTRAAMQKEATKAVRKHEKAMHGMKAGGSVSKRADGCAVRGKTKGKMV